MAPARGGEELRGQAQLLQLDARLLPETPRSHVWPVAGLFLVHSRTASTLRVRGYAQPSYNFVTLTRDLIEVEMREPGGRRKLLARYERPSGPIGEHRTIEATRVVRRQRGGSFKSKAS